jgi:hypothetical protein
MVAHPHNCFTNGPSGKYLEERRFVEWKRSKNPDDVPADQDANVDGKAI